MCVIYLPWCLSQFEGPWVVYLSSELKRRKNGTCGIKIKEKYTSHTHTLTHVCTQMHTGTKHDYREELTEIFDHHDERVSTRHPPVGVHVIIICCNM